MEWSGVGSEAGGRGKRGSPAASAEIAAGRGEGKGIQLEILDSMLATTDGLRTALVAARNERDAALHQLAQEKAARTALQASLAAVEEACKAQTSAALESLRVAREETEELRAVLNEQRAAHEAVVATLQAQVRALELVARRAVDEARAAVAELQP